jgi:hypothetical protein
MDSNPIGVAHPELAKDVFRIVFNSMLPEQRAEFVLKTRLSMVRPLVVDVLNYVIEVR